jgi:hypothetical protein
VFVIVATLRQRQNLALFIIVFKLEKLQPNSTHSSSRAGYIHSSHVYLEWLWTQVAIPAMMLKQTWANLRAQRPLTGRREALTLLHDKPWPLQLEIESKHARETLAIRAWGIYTGVHNLDRTQQALNLSSFLASNVWAKLSQGISKSQHKVSLFYLHV